ncbi:hypothetical protein [Paenarthrobacter sp. NPDC057981]|uniref:hypothetical protein n=1 Tax=Paenarthrobacter sp. NPDC057981 TaxID=3346297 RepID=UPI0036D9D2D9
MPAGTSPLPSGPVAAAKLIVAYHRAHGVLPTVAGSTGSEEAELYRALARIRLLYRQGRLEPKAAEVLEKKIPGWADGDSYNSERLWRQRRDELIRWMKKAKRPPHYASGDDAERALAAWISAYRKHARHGRHPDRIKELDTKVPGWSESPEWTPST